MEQIANEVFEKRFLQKLNPQQKTAVQTVDGNVLLLATPGSGKTTVLVTRLGYMVCCKGIAPASILTMTYTRAATKDMKDRFAALFGEDAAGNLQFRTINGISSKIIEYGSSLRGQSAFTLQDNEAELSALIRKIYQAINKEYAEDSTVKEIKTAITYIKNMMLTDEEISNLKTDVDQLPEIYTQYQAELRKQRRMDYDDQMAYARQMLLKMPTVLEWFQSQYRYICVDEAQDTSKIQHEIIKLLAAKHGNLFMVGDEDQSIYRFRAAFPEALLQFENDHPGASVLLIEENYRSTPEIIDLANRFIAQNVARHEKTIKATRASGNPVHVIYCKSREAQYTCLLEMARGCDRETAILFRNNDSALPLMDLFQKNDVPYNCRNTDDDVFFSHRVVKDVLDILRFAYDPENAEIFKRIYYKFDARISKKAAEEAAKRSAKSGKAILEELKQMPEIKGYARDSVIDLMENLPQIKDDSAETAIRRVWEAMHYGRYVEQRGFDTGKYFILCQLAKDSASVPAYLEKLEAFKNTISKHRNRDSNKVILSTIHSSKGLEYDRVFLLDVLDGILPPKADGKSAEETALYEEERRLYYVGMTRAKNDLYLFHCGDDSSFIEESSAYLPVPDIGEDDVFSFLRSPQIGKTYVGQEWGKGEIEAQCDDLFLICFGNGNRQLMTLDEMLKRRDRSTVRQTTAPSTQGRRGPGRGNTMIQASDIRVGAAVCHKTFGAGTVTRNVNGVVTIKFKSGNVKQFLLQESIAKGLLYK